MTYKKCRKHISQMTDNEKRVLTMLVRGNFVLTSHCLERIMERGITPQMVKTTIDQGNIIEYHLANGNSSRILLRGKIPFRNRVTCVVVDITKGTVVTAYTNWYYNNHPNSTFELYDENLDILKNIKNTLNFGNTDKYKRYEKNNKMKGRLNP